MKIAVIGTGNIGAAYARALVQADFEVSIGHRDPAKAAALAQQLGAHVQGAGVAASVGMADVVLLALPYAVIVDVLAAAGELQGKVLVDVSNPVSPDFKDLVVGLNTSAAEQIQAAAPGAHVVKAFNTIFAALVPAQAREGRSLQVFVAADDAQAKTSVTHIAKALGFKPVDAGPLRNSRFIEPIGMMNIQFGFFLDAGPTTAPGWSHA